MNVAFAINQDQQVFWLDSDGNVQPVSDTGFALDLNCAQDGTVWVVSTESGPDGNVIKYLSGFPSNKSHWVSLDPSLGAEQVVGRRAGGCAYLAPDQSLHLADNQGHHSQIGLAGTALRVAALGSYPIYILTDEIVDGGNVIKASSDEGKSWEVVLNGHLAKAEEIYVQIYNDVVFLDEDGAAGFIDNTEGNKIRLTSPQGTGLNLGLGGVTNQWWVVSADADETTGGNLLKWWDGGSSLASSWKTTKTPVSAIKVAGI